MGKLTEWVEQNTTLTQEKFNENDITTNERIRNLLFEQIEDLAFSVQGMNVISVGPESKRQYTIALRLDFPRKTETPYSFIFETGTKSLIPQYTITHRVYHAKVDSMEYEILSNLESYLLQNPSNDVKFNPANQRDRSQNFLMVQGVPQSDVVTFRFDSYKNEEAIVAEADGKFVIHFGDNDDIVAYQHGDKNFTFKPTYRDLRISRREVDGQLEFFLYNIPQSMDMHEFYMEARF